MKLRLRTQCQFRVFLDHPCCTVRSPWRWHLVPPYVICPLPYTRISYKYTTLYIRYIGPFAFFHPRPPPCSTKFPSPSRRVLAQMALLRRQSTYEYLDDQDPLLLGKYVGDWTHHTDPGNPYYTNYTYTVTTTLRSTLILNFSGT